jgi:hypothetical protein
MPIDEYHRDPALSKSGMQLLQKSWLDFWEATSLNPEWSYEDGSKKSRSLEFGSLVDILLFEKEKFDAEYRTGFETLATIDNRKLVNLSEYNQAISAINELWRVEYCRYILTGFYQVSVFWRDKETGVMLKMRPDVLKTHVTTDYKTIKDLALSTIAYQLDEYGYAVQGIMGKVGISQLKEELRKKKPKIVIQGADTPEHKEFLKQLSLEPRQEFRNLFQRNSKPYPFRIVHIDEDAENKAYEIFRASVKKYQRCITQYGVSRPPAGENTSEEISSYSMPYRFATKAQDIY